MKRQLSELRSRLRIKKLSKLVDLYVYHNFGYCPPGNPEFDRIQEKLREEVEIARIEYPKNFEYYMNHLIVN